MRNCKKIIIAGAGLMGTSMAQIFAQKDFEVIIYDIAEQALQRSKDLIAINQSTQIKNNEITKETSDKLLNLLSHTCSKDCFKDCDLVIESVIEKMEIKHSFWKEISEIVPEDAILASNTSGLSITKIAQAVKSPYRFAGMHWYNPAHLIPLVEIIKGDESATETVDYLYNLSAQIGKEPIRVNKDIAGFIGNRLQLSVLRESLYLVENGVGSYEDIDKCMKYALGFRYACLGPFEVCDIGGLDTFYHIADYLNEDLCRATEPQKTLKELYEKGEFGVKSKKGFYDYSDGKDEQAIRKRDDLYMKVAKLHKD